MNQNFEQKYHSAIAAADMHRKNAGLLLAALGIVEPVTDAAIERGLARIQQLKNDSVNFSVEIELLKRVQGVGRDVVVSHAHN